MSTPRSLELLEEIRQNYKRSPSQVSYDFFRKKTHETIEHIKDNNVAARKKRTLSACGALGAALAAVATPSSNESLFMGLAAVAFLATAVIYHRSISKKNVIRDLSNQADDELFRLVRDPDGQYFNIDKQEKRPKDGSLLTEDEIAEYENDQRVRFGM